MRITRRYSQWFLDVVVDIEKKPVPPQKPFSVVFIDLGVRTFATCLDVARNTVWEFGGGIANKIFHHQRLWDRTNWDAKRREGDLEKHIKARARTVLGAEAFERFCSLQKKGCEQAQWEHKEYINLMELLWKGEGGAEAEKQYCHLRHKAGQKRRLARTHMEHIQNLKQDLHARFCRWLLDNFDLIVIPPLDVARMEKKKQVEESEEGVKTIKYRKIGKMTARQMLSLAQGRGFWKWWSPTHQRHALPVATSTGSWVAARCSTAPIRAAEPPLTETGMGH